MTSNESFETLDPENWDEMRALAHRIVDDALIYLTYSKPVEWEGMSGFTVALARGRLVGDELTEVADLFVAIPQLEEELTKIGY